MISLLYFYDVFVFSPKFKVLFGFKGGGNVWLIGCPPCSENGKAYLHIYHLISLQVTELSVN